jgi:hypothetical protein
MTDYDLKKLEELVENGLTVKEISNELNISISTVKRLMSKHELKSKSFSLKRESKECLNCRKQFSSLIMENRKFCCSSCSSSYNNFLRPKKEITKKKRIRVFRERKIGVCENCHQEIIRKDGRTQAKYCSIQCQADFRMFERIENNKASTKTLKLFLIRKHGEKCMKCGWCEKNPISNKVPIELEHKDGNSENNNLDNLELLCPNCHSLTSTYKALNKGNGRHKRRVRYKEGKSY